MRKLAVIGSALAGRTAVLRIASVSTAPKKILASARKVIIDLGKKGGRPGGPVNWASIERRSVETPRLYLVETDYDQDPRGRFDRRP